MSIWIPITVAFVSWWLGFIAAGLLASAKFADELSQKEKREERTRDKDQ